MSSPKPQRAKPSATAPRGKSGAAEGGAAIEGGAAAKLPGERLQKIIARSGLGSRRSAEELILGGRVRVNGRVVTELGARADPWKDKVEVDGKRLMAETLVYLVLHKPKNVVSTLRDPEGRHTVGEILRRAGSRVYPVGRLDFATSGVLLATNDGEFANGLLHPRKEVPKTYVVKVQGIMAEEDLQKWQRGVQLEDGPTLPARVRLLRHEEDKTWFEITITEGRNHQLRRMGDATGFRVMRLARVAFAGITHDGLRPGDYRPLTATELTSLRDTYGVPKKIRARAAPPDAGRGAAARGRGAVTAARTDRSGTRPRGADSRAAPARGREGRSGSRGRS